MGPCNPNMALESTRIESFHNGWPGIQASVKEIAEAGFYFLGVRDKVKCWNCNGGLQLWEYFDNPWHEHAKWFPTCSFLLEKKGVDFVRNIVALYPGIKRPRLKTQQPTRDPNCVQQPVHDPNCVRQPAHEPNCVICLSSTPNIALLPCGHVCTCEECSRRVINCPICRGTISNIIRVYIA